MRLLNRRFNDAAGLAADACRTPVPGRAMG